MDVFAHALWSTAGGIAARRKFHWRIHLGWLAAWSVLPDLVVFVIPAAVRIGRFATGASKTLLADGSGPRFDWAFGIYNVTHSAVVWGFCFGAVWIVAHRPVMELLGWALHIAIDIFTHTGIFAIKFLWPLSSVHFDGIRWEKPWFLALTYLALAVVFLINHITKSGLMEGAEGTNVSPPAPPACTIGVAMKSRSMKSSA